MPISESNCRLIEARGLDVELLENYGVTDTERRGFDLVFNYAVNGEVIARKHRRINKSATAQNFVQDVGARQAFWNAAAISDETLSRYPLVICEGEFDALSAIQAGFVRSVSVPNGAPTEGEHEGGRYQYVDAVPDDCQEIILAVDSDEPGKRLLHALALKLGKDRCKWVEYPEGCKDLNDALRLFGPRGVTEAISRARWMDIPGLYRMSELPPLPDTKPHDVGIPGLEEHYKARLGDFVVVTGIPNHGKSALTTAIACHLALRHKWPVAMASFETRPQIELKRQLRTWYNSAPEKDQTPQELATADDWIEKWFSFITPAADDDADLLWLLERLRAAVTRHGAKCIIIDPWNEIDHNPPQDMSRTEYTGWCIRRLKKFAMSNLVHLIVVAHPAKIQRDRDGKIPMPNLYDIADSAHWANKPEVGVIVHRRTEEETIIKVAKSRYHDTIGRPGEVSVRFVWQRAAFELCRMASPRAGETP
jgi:twinkle protein